LEVVDSQEDGSLQGLGLNKILEGVENAVKGTVARSRAEQGRDFAPAIVPSRSHPQCLGDGEEGPIVQIFSAPGEEPKSALGGVSCDVGQHRTLANAWVALNDGGSSRAFRYSIQEVGQAADFARPADERGAHGRERNGLLNARNIRHLTDVAAISNRHNRFMNSSGVLGRIAITVEGRQPIRGVIDANGGEMIQPFVGWLGLLKVLEESLKEESVDDRN